MHTTKLLSQGYQTIKLVETLKKFYGRHHDPVSPYNVAVSRIVSDVFASDAPKVDFPKPGHTLLPIFPSFMPMGMVGEACLPSNANHPRTPDYTLYSGCLLVWTFWFATTFQFPLFDLVILLIRRRCHTFSRLLMPTIRGDCGHLKTSWDNYTNCLSCSSCFRYSTCLVCKNWTGSLWELADKRRLYLL